MKICKRCNKQFQCSSTKIETCFCTKITIPDNVKKYLQLQFKDCICEQCIIELLEVLPIKDVNS